MNRWKASATHLTICLLVAASILIFMLLAWFPTPYFSAHGGKELLFLILSVDIVLGPLITLIIYKHGKKSLKFDLTVIVLLQIGALGYGIATLAQARPAYLVFSVDRLELINVIDLEEDQLKLATLEQYKTIPFTGPQLVAVEQPTDPDERNAILFSSLDGLDISGMPKYYVPYEQQKDAVIKRLHPLEKLHERAKKAHIDLAKVIKDSGLKETQLGFLPVKAKKHDLTAILERESAKIVAVIEIDPWIYEK
jgi:hypothetical protein